MRVRRPVQRKPAQPKLPHIAAQLESHAADTKKPLKKSAAECPPLDSGFETRLRNLPQQDLHSPKPGKMSRGSSYGAVFEEFYDLIKDFQAGGFYPAFPGNKVTPPGFAKSGIIIFIPFDGV